MFEFGWVEACFHMTKEEAERQTRRIGESVAPLIRNRKRSISHTGSISVAGTSKEQAPQKTMRGLFLMQRIVKRDAEGHQYPYR